jgi:glycosyltransferase involved in cell wall biosynthesis
MKKEIRIIVLFGSPFLYGSEKANIDVFRALAEYEHVKVLFLIDEKRGFDEIVSYLQSNSLSYVPVSYHFMFRKGMSIKEWSIKINEVIIGSFQLLKYYRKFKPTHLYTSKPEYFLNFLPILFFVRRPIIYRIGDSPVVHNFVYQYLWSYIVKKVSKFICVSKYIEQQVQTYVNNSLRTEVIYSRPHSREKGINVNSDKISYSFTVLYVGQIGKHKGLDLLIESAILLCKKYDKINFNIAGKLDKDEPFAGNQIAKVDSSGLSDRIRFLGYISNVNDLYKMANLHVCPSVYEEPLANVLIDAKMFGIPSIIFPVGGLPEIIEHKINGYICEEKTALSLFNAIEYYFLNQSICEQTGRNAFNSLEQIEIEKFGEKWLNVFEQLS